MNYAIIVRVFNDTKTSVFLYPDNRLPVPVLLDDIKWRVEQSVGHLIQHSDIQVVHILTSMEPIDIYQ